VILQSPGGSAEGAESVVKLLRDRFTDVRFIVPIAAKSAATMLALSGNAVVMDTTSELGPTDPQRVFRRTAGAMAEIVVSPVMAIKEMWDRIVLESAEPILMPKPRGSPVTSGNTPSSALTLERSQSTTPLSSVSRW
jgi:hypothetical protein